MINSNFVKNNTTFIIYATIGMTGVFLDLLFFYLLTTIFKVNQYISNIISITIGLSNNFFWNRKYNFRKYDKTIIRYLLFYLVGICGLMISSFLIFIMHDIMQIDVNISKAISIVPATLTQFILNKTITFKI